MIEINLLPPQYRAIERTPLPVFLGLLAGIALIGGGIFFYAIGIQQTQGLKEDLAAMDQRVVEAQAEEREFDELQRKINQAQTRIQTVLKIAESKIPWSIKLEQLVEVMPRDIWIDRLDAERRPDGSGELKLQVNARGTSLGTMTAFKQVLRSTTNFYYHFDEVIVDRVDTRETAAGVIEPEYLFFEMRLPLRQVERGGKQTAKR